MMKKLLTVLLCVLMCVSVLPAALAADSGDKRDIGLEMSLASQLRELGLFRGVAENDDGTADFGLGREPGRLESLVMLVRILGKGAEAEACPKTHPFTDVPVWADGYVSYAYDNGLTQGVSDTLFGAEDAAPAETYLTFMLRALGYTEGVNGDFTRDAPQALAAWCGILPARVVQTDFLRADMVDVTCAALYADLKGTRTALHEHLASEGAFTGERFDAAFPDDPFAAERLLDGRVSEAIAARVPLGMVENNVYAEACHVVTDIADSGGVLTVSALVCYGKYILNKNGGLGGGSTVAPWLIELDADTLEPGSCRLACELREEGFALTEFFSDETLAALSRLRMPMRAVCTMEVRAQMNSGAIAYRQPTYDESLAKAKASLSEVLQTLETEPCTILLGRYDYPGGHGNPPCYGRYYEVWLVYKSGSAVGGGETETFRGSTEGELRLSEDGLTLYYSYHYHTATPTGPHCPPESGTCTYTIDLNTRNSRVSYEADEGCELP